MLPLYYLRPEFRFSLLHQERLCSRLLRCLLQVNSLRLSLPVPGQDPVLDLDSGPDPDGEALVTVGPVSVAGAEALAADGAAEEAGEEEEAGAEGKAEDGVEAVEEAAAGAVSSGNITC